MNEQQIMSAAGTVASDQYGAFVISVANIVHM